MPGLYCYSNIFMPWVTTPVTGITEVGVRLQERRVVSAVCTCVGKRLHTLPSHPILGVPQGY